MNINKELSRIAKGIVAIEFDNQKALDEYKKTHDIRKDTRLTVKKPNKTKESETGDSSSSNFIKEKHESQIPIQEIDNNHKTLKNVMNRYFEAVDKEEKEKLWQAGCSIAQKTINQCESKIFDLFKNIGINAEVYRSDPKESFQKDDGNFTVEFTPLVKNKKTNGFINFTISIMDKQEANMGVFVRVHDPMNDRAGGNQVFESPKEAIEYLVRNHATSGLFKNPIYVKK